MTAYDDIMREYREFFRYTGDGLPGEPVNAPLPVGDPSTGVWSPKKANIRKALGNLALELITSVANVITARDQAIGQIQSYLPANYEALRDQTLTARDLTLNTRDETLAIRNSVALTADGAAVNAGRAEQAAQAALVAGGPIYPDIATGRAAVADNAFFRVASSNSDVLFALYRRLTSTTQEFWSNALSKQALDSKFGSQALDAVAPQYDPAFLNMQREIVGGVAADGSLVTMAGRFRPRSNGEADLTATGGNVRINGVTAYVADIDGVGFFKADEYGYVYYAEDAAGNLLTGQNFGSGGGTIVLPLPSVAAGDYYQRANGDVFPVLADMTKASGWGSSSMNRTDPYLQTLLAPYGMTYFLGGKGSEQIEQSAARQGAVPFLVTFPSNQIPAAATTTAVTVSNGGTNNSSLLAYDVDFIGTDGVTVVRGSMSYASGSFQFARAAAGNAVPVAAGVPAISLQGEAYRGGIEFLWLGKNNFNSAVPNAEANVIAKTDTCFSYITSLSKRCIIIGQFVDGNTDPASEEYRQIMATIRYQKAKYKNLYVDIQAWMCSAQAWADTGITPTSSDLTQQANGQKPTSLSADSGHFSPAVYQVIAQKLLLARVVQLGWLKANS